MYDKPLFADKGSSLYRPKAATEDELAAGGGAAEGRHFKPDKGFAGVDYGAATRGGGGPVQFEKDQEEDPFGLEVGAEIWGQPFSWGHSSGSVQNRPWPVHAA